jgi:ketosteroid isomerase-like protein
MMPGSSGSESIRALFEGMVAEGAPASFDIVADNVTLAESGELAYETGHYTAAGQMEGETWEAQGKYLAVWKKNAEDQWKTVALSWSPNATPPAMDYAAEEAKSAAPAADAAPEAGTTDPAPAGETN